MDHQENVIRLEILLNNMNQSAPPEDDINVYEYFKYTPPSLDNQAKSTKDHAFEKRLKEAINVTRNTPNSLLLIDSNNYMEFFREDIFLDYLRLIEQSGVNFKINGLEYLDKNSIRLFINIYEQKKRNQEYVQKERLANRRKSSSSEQQKKESPGVKALTSKKNIQHIRLKKRQLADVDPNNIEARKLIHEMKQEGMSDYRISKALNEKGIVTSRNSQFQANTVKRQFVALKELEKQFYANTELEDMAFKGVPLDRHSNQKQVALKQIPLQFEYESEVQDKLVLKFSEEIESWLDLQIFNNKKEIVFQHQVDPGTKNVVLNLLNDTPIGPGRYYGKLQGISQDKKQMIYTPLWIAFIVRKDVVPTDDPLIGVISPSDSQ